MPDNAGIAPETIAKFREQLEQERARLQQTLRFAPELGGTEEHDAFTDEPGDFGDLAQDIMNTDTQRAVDRNEERLLAQVNRALQRMDEGIYGLSEISGRPIPVERLEAIPWATTNVDDPDPNPQPDTQPMY
jgi:RNA polymerase-binding transcription factor